MGKELLLLITGGTIDGEWNPATDTVVPSKHSGIKKYIEKYVKPDFTIEEKVVGMYDSRDIDDDVRAKLLYEIQKSKSDKILITHGTYTMVQTGLYLKEKLGSSSKTIILTGAFWPLDFAQTDAGFNLGFAIASFENLVAGVYVSINGRVFSPSNIEKDVKRAKFVEKGS